ncbi:MAG: hypothetical protein ACFFCS_21430 [Candidatus Hodarchaeota archaeon]
MNIYWGDIHGHSLYSDGSGDGRYSYEYARDSALLDFCALTDHLEIFPQIGEITLFGRFEEYLDLTNSFNEDGVFSTIIAAEWTPLLAPARDYLCTQHMNFYFPRDEFPYFSTFTEFTPDEVYEFLKEAGYEDFIAWTHHSTSDSYSSDFAFYDENINTMIEIYSCHGGSEFQGDRNLYPMVLEIDEQYSGYSVNDGFKMGRKFGIMASSDTHDGRMGHTLLHNEVRTLLGGPETIVGYKGGIQYHGGLTAVITENLTRQQIFSSLKTKSAYASTWVNRPILNFSIDGLTVGINDSTLIVPSVDTPRNISVFVAIDGVSLTPNHQKNIHKIEIFKNSVLWHEETVNSFAFQDVLQDSINITGTSYEGCIQKDDDNWYIHERSIKPVDPLTLNTNGEDYYYLRVTDTDGGAAWVGPIWVRAVT